MSKKRYLLPLVLIAWARLTLGPSLGEEPDASPSRHGQHQAGNFKNSAEMKAVLRDVVARASAATVRIFCDDQPAALGTVISADGRIVTKASQLSGKISCRTADGRQWDATLVGRDDDCDLALLRVDARDLVAVTWREGDAPLPGTLVVATSHGAEPLAVGVISDLPQEIPGPNRGWTPRSWLGIELGEGDNALEVQGVTPHSAAAAAGLQAGDWIRRIDGTPVASARQLVRAVGDLPPDRTVKLGIVRQDKELELTATLGRLPRKRLPQDYWGGGPFSERRWGFAVAIPHDLVIAPTECGGPLVDTDGNAVGINIARALRVASYALPPQAVRQAVEKMGR